MKKSYRPGFSRPAAFPGLRDIVTVLGVVGGGPGGETPRVADSSAAGAGPFFHNSVPRSKQNRLGTPPEQCATFARSINLSRDFPQATLKRAVTRVIKVLAVHALSILGQRSRRCAAGIVLPKTDREDDFCKSFHKIPTPRQVCGDTASL